MTVCNTHLLIYSLQITGKEDDSWFRAELNGAEGVVPGNYVEFKPPM